MDSSILFLSLEGWDEIWRRNQFVCAEVARRIPECQIVFVEPPFDVSNTVRHGRLGELKRHVPRTPKGFPNVRIVKGLKWLPNTLSLGHAFNVWHYKRFLKRTLQQFKIRRFFLWINDHSFEAVVGTVGESASLYDITDDWTSFDQADWLRRRVVRQDASLCMRANATIVCSQRLWDLKRPTARNLHLVPNGVDIEHYSQVCQAGLAVPELSKSWKRPVLGYTGTIHPDRVDLALIEAIATKWSGSLALVGPNHLPKEAEERLFRLGNVHLPGPQPYSEIPNWMRAFDVCITPHRVSDFTESLNPIKLWEYLASGKPIVSTPVAGFRDYNSMLYLASDADGFCSACEAALTEPTNLQEVRRNAVRNQTWSARVDNILQIMDQVDPSQAWGRR